MITYHLNEDNLLDTDFIVTQRREVTSGGIFLMVCSGDFKVKKDLDSAGLLLEGSFYWDQPEIIL